MEEVAARCDLCWHAFEEGETCYTYGTPSSAEYEEVIANKIIEALGGPEQPESYWAQDPLWGACEDCHKTIQRYLAKELSDREATSEMAARLLINERREYFWIPPEDHLKAMSEHGIPTIWQFLLHMVPEYYTEVIGGQS